MVETRRFNDFFEKVLTAHLSNPNTKVETADLSGVIRKIAGELRETFDAVEKGDVEAAVRAAEPTPPAKALSVVKPESKVASRQQAKPTKNQRVVASAPARTKGKGVEEVHQDELPLAQASAKSAAPVKISFSAKAKGGAASKGASKAKASSGKAAGRTQVAPIAPALKAKAEPKDEMRSRAREDIAASTVTAPAGKRADRDLWPGVSPTKARKFRELIEEHSLICNSDGMPMPCRSKLISDDGTKVLDPIDGGYYAMLRSHLRVRYGLKYEELLAMFGLTSNQLPKAGPSYSQSKSLSALKQGFGKNLPAKDDKKRRVEA